MRKTKVLAVAAGIATAASLVACSASAPGDEKITISFWTHTHPPMIEVFEALIEEYEPYLVEDPVRTEQFNEDIPKLRKLTTVPLAAGEEWGQRWDFNKLVEEHDIDYVRCTLPNVGGITEMMMIASTTRLKFCFTRGRLPKR